jgi:hypothetical protein
MTTHDLLQRLNDYNLPGKFTQQGDRIDWYWCLSNTTEDSKADQEELSDNRRHVMEQIDQLLGHYVEMIDI